MAYKRKAASPSKAGTLGKTASIKQANDTPILQRNQQPSQIEIFSTQAKILVASLFERIACWEMLLAALMVFLFGGLVHA